MKIKLRRREEHETPASAMSDIAFLLIVFFIVIAVFAVKEGFIMNLPEREKIVKKASKDILKVQLAPNLILISGDKVEKETFKETLKKAKDGKRVVILEVKSATLYKEVIFVLDQFAQLDIREFAMRKWEG